MLALLPKLLSAILTAGARKESLKRFGQMISAVLEQLLPRKFTHIPYCFGEPLVVKVCIKQDEMEMGGHDDKGVGAEVLVGVAVIEAVCDDFAGASAMKMGSHSTTVKVRK